ncbi:hypothetical protein B0H11DRAFT_2067149 [Mycena galericulata]|nr:hypothetical protein B0H11DRAFT_2067149 [Mycena galericulata]
MTRLLFYIALLISAVQSSYSPAPRWGQATSLIYSALFIQGGKQDPDGGQTYNSALAQEDLLWLPLTASFSVDAPPWQLISDPTNATNSQGPAVAWHTLSAFNSTMLLVFGGMPSPSVALSTQPDSSWLLDVYDRLRPEFTHETLGWADEPIRRIHHAAVTATTGEVYIFGGEKADESGLLSDCYVFNPSTSEFTALPTENGPPALTGHAAIILPNGKILVFGGLTSTGLLSFTTMWIFDTSANSWSSPNVSSETAFPLPRRAFAYVLVDPDTILIHGGCDGDFQNVYSDGWIYNISAATWTAVEPLSAIGPRIDHFAASYGSQVIFGFGYGQNGPANASLIIYDPDSQTFLPTFTPPSPTASITATIPGASTTTGLTTTPSGSGTQTGSVHPTSTHGSGGGSGSGSGGSGGTGGGSEKEPLGASSKTTTIAVATVLAVFALVGAGLGAVWYMRKQQRRRWAEGGVGGVFSPLHDEEGGAGGTPAAARMFDSAPGEKGLLSGAAETVGATLSSWGLWVVGALGLGGIVGGGVAAAERDRKQRRDMLADEDLRDFGGWYEEGDGHSSRMGRRQGSGGSNWSLMSVFRPRPRREGSAASNISYGSRLHSHGGSLLGHTEGPSEKDPFRDDSFLHDAAAAGGAGILASSTRPRGQRQSSFASAYSVGSNNYVDPFADPISEQDLAGPGALLMNMHQGYSRTGPLSPVTEVSRISSSGASHSGSSNDHQVLSPFDTLSRSSLGFSSNSHASPALPPGASPAVSPGPSTISARTQPRTSSILDMKPAQPDQPIRRSDTWWARFSSKSLLDRRSSRGSATAVGAPDIRDPNPLPQRLGFVEEETPSVLRERSDGSDTSRAAGPVYGKGAAHGKSMSSLQTQRTADSAALERMGGNVDVMLRGNRQSGSTSTRASVTTHGGSGDDEPASARHSWQPSGDDNEPVFISPVEMVPASAFNLPTSPPREVSPPPAPRPPLSTSSSSGSSGSGAVAERIQAYERRMSQDVTPPSPTNTKHREERPRKKTHGVNYGIVPRASLFVANPDHRAREESGDA